MNEVELQAGIDRAAELIVGSEYTTALVGAGMSVESGIPPFRGPGGIWTKYGEPPMDGYQKMLQDPEGYWLERNSDEGPMAEFRSTFEQARPNPGHLAMAEMEEIGYLRCIITQNVDNLHQQAGSRNVAEIHGNSMKLRCVGCNSRWAAEEYGVTDYPPLCDDCGGIIKADTVMFGEPIPFDVLVKCDQESKKSDCMMLVGTTAEVYPAASFPHMIKQSGGVLIEVNPYDTVISGLCDVVLRGPSGEVLPRLVERVRALKPGGSG